MRCGPARCHEMSSRLIGTISHSTTPHACPCSSSHAFTLQSLQALVANDGGEALRQCRLDSGAGVASSMLLRVGGLLLLHHAQGVCSLQAHMAQELHDVIADISTTAGAAHQPPSSCLIVTIYLSLSGPEAVA